MRLFVSALIAMFSLTVAFAPLHTARAQSAQPLVSKEKANEPPLPAPLLEQRERGAQVYYLGKFDTLEGWVMIRTGQPEFYYATPGNKAVVLGFLFDAAGKLQTGEQLKQVEAAMAAGTNGMVAPKATPMPDTATKADDKTDTKATTAVTPPAITPPAVTEISPPLSTANAAPQKTRADTLFEEVVGGSSAVLGNPNAPAFYAFIDTNCLHCQRFLRESEDALLQGRISIHVLPVAFDDKSLKQGAFVLASADGTERLLQYAKGKTDALPAPSGVDTKGVENNTKLMTQWNLDGTPIIFYKAGNTGEVKIIRGRPADINTAIADLVGGPAKQ